MRTHGFPSPAEVLGGILAQLRADHTSIRALFHAFAMLAHEEEDQRARVVDELCDALTLHAVLEDELFYPVLEALVDDSVLEDAALEHDSMIELVEQLSTMFPYDDYFDISVSVLAQEVEHHVAFEEQLLFPALARSGADQLELGQRLRARRAQLESDAAAAVPAFDGCEPYGLLRDASGAPRERRARPR